MRITLVFPPFYLESLYNLPPLGLVNLATGLDASRHQVELVDFVLAVRLGTVRTGPGIYDECADRILEGDPDLVGFSAQCTTYPAVVGLARRIKDRKPDTHVVVGGHNASFVDTQTLERYPQIDAVMRGEGEITFPEWVQAVETRQDLPGVAGVTYRDGGRVIRNPDRPLIERLDDLPLPRYELLPSFSEYRDACDLPRSIAILEAGRGCPHRCVYCSESILWRRRTRRYSTDRLVREMRHLHERFGAECFLLAYDQFTSERSFVTEFCRRLMRENLHHVPWYCISRLDSVDASLLRLMRDAGCESMCYGIDSGSPRTLAFIRKRIDRDILFQRVQETTAAGIVPTLSFVVGFPEEEAEDIDATLELALRTGVLGNVNPLIQMPTVLPGTELHTRYLGDLVRVVDSYFALGLELDHGKRLESDERLIDSDPEVFSSFYNVPCRGRTLEELHRITRYFPLIVNLYPKSFLLLSVERGEGVSELFLDWLEWVGKRLSRREPFCSPRDCYEHFPSFVEQRRARAPRSPLPHLSDMLLYETKGIEAARFGSAKDFFFADVHGLNGLKPLRSPGTLIQEFRYPIPEIIGDIKQGRFLEEYRTEPTVLVFRVGDSRLDVNEINAFGRDLLSLCDGNTSLHEISEELYSRYGADAAPERFFRECVEAVQTLGRMRLIESERQQNRL